jgi:hypothetical protein
LVVRGTMPAKAGIPPVLSAIDWPCRFISTVAKSFDSRTMVEKAVRSSAVAASSAMATSRLHQISRVIGSMVSLSREGIFFLFAAIGCGPWRNFRNASPRLV